jgi:hypothetical protein
MKRVILLVAVLAAALSWAACSSTASAPAAAAAPQAGEGASDENMVPYFEADPTFPKPLPNNWAYGAVVGVAVDAQQRVWIIHRPSMMTRERNAADGVASYCCYPAPPIIVYDQAGNFVKAWGPIRKATRGQAVGDGGTTNAPATGGPPAATIGGDIDDPKWKDHWPESEHGIHVDYKGFVWTGGNGQKDSRILKFDENGKFIMQIGNYSPYGTKGPGHDGGPDSSDTKNLNKPTTMAVDPKTDEIYVADGYGNRRLIVFDANTGAYKRHWGAYGNPPDDKDPYNATRGNTDKTYDPKIVSKQFGRATHGTALSTDGHVYVADRPNHRVQAFTLPGSSSAKVFTDRNARGTGAAGAVVVSPDQRWLYITGQPELTGLDRPPVGSEEGGILRNIQRLSRWFLRGPRHRRGRQGEHLHGRDADRPARAAVPLQGNAPAPKQDWVD